MELGEKLTIDTPEQVSLEFPLAGLGSRFMALAVDTIIQFIAFFVLGIVFVFLLPGTIAIFGGDGGVWEIAVAILVIFLIYWGYFAVFETMWQGQTPGKREAGIRVIRDNGASIGAREAVARNLLRIADSFPGFYGVGIVTVFLNKQNKRLGDYVAGTVVVHERAQEEAQPFFNARREVEETVYDMAAIKPEEVEMVETFLARRLDFPSEVRRETARRMAEHFAVRLNLAASERPANEELLETVVRQFRKSARYR